MHVLPGDRPELGEQRLVRFHGIRGRGCMLAEEARPRPTRERGLSPDGFV